jgi:hypothetical protein
MTVICKDDSHSLPSFDKWDAERIVNGLVRQRTHGIGHALVGAEEPNQDHWQWQADGRQDEDWCVFHGIHGLFTPQYKSSGEDHEQEGGGEECECHGDLEVENEPSMLINLI